MTMPGWLDREGQGTNGAQKQHFASHTAPKRSPGTQSNTRVLPKHCNILCHPNSILVLLTTRSAQINGLHRKQPKHTREETQRRLE